MKIEFINPFVKAAIEVLKREIGSEVERGRLRVESNQRSNQDVNVLIGVTGAAQGFVLFSMSMTTACSLVEQMLGQPFAEFDELAQSGIAEMGNVITGLASQGLADSGYLCNITPPTLITGQNTTIGTLNIPRLALPLITNCGDIEIHLALFETNTPA